MKHTFLALIACLCFSLPAAVQAKLAVKSAEQLTAEKFIMRDRVFVDAVAGISFRYPYECYMPNPYGGEIKGYLRQGRKKPTAVRYVFMSFDKEALAQEVDVLDLDQVIDHIGAKRFRQYIDYEYYSDDDQLPHRKRSWAPQDIRVRIGFDDQLEVILIDHGQRISALKIYGNDWVNERLVASLEVMKKMTDASSKQSRFLTWNQHMYEKGRALLPEGKHLEVKKMKRPETWPSAYELETEHFHITTTCTPKYVLSRAAFLESMYQGLSKWLPCEQKIKSKYEVHITKTRSEFNEIGDYLYGDVNRAFNVRSNSMLGGFFNPMSQATYTFTERVKHSSMSSRVRLAHEFVHQYMFLHSSYNWLPGWLNEGMAVIFEEGFKDRTYQSIASPKVRLRLLKQVYKQHGFLGDLQKYVQGAGIGNVHQYAEAHAILHHQLRQKDGILRLQEFWRRFKKRERATVLFKKIFVEHEIGTQPNASDYEQWQRSIMRHVNSGAAHKALHLK